MYTVYILFSEQLHKYYVGYSCKKPFKSSDLEVVVHNICNDSYSLKNSYNPVFILTKNYCLTKR